MQDSKLSVVLHLTVNSDNALDVIEGIESFTRQHPGVKTSSLQNFREIEKVKIPPLKYNLKTMPLVSVRVH